MAQDNTYYLDEALYISAQAPTGSELAFIGGGGGGPGAGGWGLSDGAPRGTSPTKKDIAQVISTRRVLTEEFQVTEKDYSDKYAQEVNQLPETINALKAQIKAEAQSSSNASSAAAAEQQILTSRIRQLRDAYLQKLPDANSYFGAPAFYKRGDSMMSRFLDPGFFTATTGEALGVEWATKLQRSWDGAYRLHLDALKHQALADELATLAAHADQEEIDRELLDLPQAIARRTAQIHTERQVHFDCLPNVLQHELNGQTRIDDSLTLAQTLQAYLSTAAALRHAKQSQIPHFQDRNPRINAPLSKPQLEGLLHLVDEQRLRRAGPRWKEYHQALALSESIQFLDVYTRGTQNLAHRAVAVEHLLARHTSDQAANQQAQAAAAEAGRQQALVAAQEAARLQAERKAKEEGFIYRRVPGQLQAIEKPAAERKAKKARQKAEAERRAKEAADKAAAQRQAREQAQLAKAEARAERKAQKLEEDRKAREAVENASAERQAKNAARLEAAARRENEAKQKREALRIQEENERSRITFALGHTAASLPLVVPVGPSSFGNPATAYEGLKTAIRSAVTGLAASGAAQALIATLAMAWPSSLGNSDRRYLTSIPLQDLSSPGGPDLETLALSSHSVDLPYLLAGSETTDDLNLYVIPGGKPVPVRVAKFDRERQVYSLALTNPQRILTWTPALAPGAEAGSSTSLPQVPQGTVIYTGSTLNPVNTETEGYPALDLLDQERLIITFPMDSGLPPILVVFKSPRYEAGTSTGNGAQVTDTWRTSAASLEGAPIPAQIADLLRGNEYGSFDAFRRQFWKAVANDPELSKQFSPQDIRRMKKHGYSPWVDRDDEYMSKRSHEIHHVVPISKQGGVYDMDNLIILTPKAHNHIHYGKSNLEKQI